VIPHKQGQFNCYSESALLVWFFNAVEEEAPFIVVLSESLEREAHSLSPFGASHNEVSIPAALHLKPGPGAD
jgi:hypothetical protein